MDSRGVAAVTRPRCRNARDTEIARGPASPSGGYHRGLPARPAGQRQRCVTVLQRRIVRSAQAV